VTREEVRATLDSALARGDLDARGLATRLQRGTIDVVEFERSMKRLVKSVHIYSAAAARGGFAQLTAADDRLIASLIRAQFRYMDRFIGQLRAGLPLDGRFVARAELYTEAARTTYVEFDRLLNEELGNNLERSILHKADHCDECPREARKGWRPIGTIIPVGSRVCGVRCRCSMEYRRGIPMR
jgi:hypothetical protein